MAFFEISAKENINVNNAYKQQIQNNLNNKSKIDKLKENINISGTINIIIMINYSSNYNIQVLKSSPPSKNCNIGLIPKTKIKHQEIALT